MLLNPNPYQIVIQLWPINRSLGGEGFRKSLKILKKYLPSLRIRKIPSGTKLGTWTVPQEWKVIESHVIDPSGKKIFDYFINDLYLVSYSKSFSGVLNLEDLKKKIFYSDNQTSAIPYKTSYYKKDWGLCASKNELERLNEGDYRVKIKTRHIHGNLNFGEIFIQGKSNSEIIFSTYLCHPQMASNELSGPAVLTSLASKLEKMKKKSNYSYRFLFLPETIGAIYYLKKNLIRMKKNVIAGFVCTCLGDKGDFSFIGSKYGNNFAEKFIARTLIKTGHLFQKYSFLERGSDERQFMSPAVDLPFCTLTRTPFGKYPEYHTSLDNLDFISEHSLKQSVQFLEKMVEDIDKCIIPVSQHIGEPFLTKYNLRESFGGGKLSANQTLISHVIAFSDGTNDIVSLSELIPNTTETEIKKIVQKLVKRRILKLK